MGTEPSGTSETVYLQLNILFFLLQGHSEKPEERREGTHFWWQNSQRQDISGEGSSPFRPQNEKQEQSDTETVNGTFRTSLEA